MEKYNYVITTKISTKQKETLDKLKSKNIKISNFSNQRKNINLNKNGNYKKS